MAIGTRTGGNDEIPTLPQLISTLRASFLMADFDRVEAALLAREAEMKRQNEKQKIELEFERLEKMRIEDELEAEKTKKKTTTEFPDEDREVISQLRRRNRQLETDKSDLEREYQDLEKRVVSVEDDTLRMVTEILTSPSAIDKIDWSVVNLNLEKVFDFLIAANANGGLRNSVDLKRDLERAREEYAALEKKHNLDIVEMQKLEKECESLGNELEKCKAELEGVKEERDAANEKFEKLEEEVKKQQRDEEEEGPRRKNRELESKAELEKVRKEYAALEKKHNFDVLEVQKLSEECESIGSDLNKFMVELVGVKKERDAANEKYEKLVEEVKKQQGDGEEDAVRGKDMELESEAEGGGMCKAISLLEGLMNAKRLGLTKAGKRSRDSGMEDGSRKKMCTDHIIDGEDLCDPVPANGSSPGNGAANSGTPKISSAKYILLSDSDDDCTFEELPLKGIKRERASPPNASDNDNESHNVEETIPTTAKPQDSKLKRCPLNSEQIIIRSPEEKVLETLKLTIDDSDSTSMFSSDDSEDEDDFDPSNLILSLQSGKSKA